jgi:hypothetical protein
MAADIGSSALAAGSRSKQLFDCVIPPTLATHAIEPAHLRTRQLCELPRRSDQRWGWRVGLVLEAAGSVVILDESRDMTDVSGELDGDGGFAITHTGTLCRQNGCAFGIAALRKECSDLEAIS